jgi:hypothetical protein
VAQAPKKKTAVKKAAEPTTESTAEQVIAETEIEAIPVEQAAALVKREIPVIKDKRPTGEARQVPVQPDEVLDYAEYDDHVVVVTKDGLKLRGDK